MKEVLARAADPADATFRDVFGLVADVLNVSVEAAPLIEIALGQAAQYVAASPSDELMNYLHKESNRLAGRVGFIWLEGVREEHSVRDVNLEGQPGVLGRADRFVETHPKFAPLVARLLGRTWIVENLRRTVELAESCAAGVNFVALTGELLQADGTLVVGPRHGSTGLITRRSELRALGVQLEELRTAIGAAETAAAGFEAQTARLQKAAAAYEKKRQQAADRLAQMRLLITAAEERRAQLDQQKNVQAAELAAAEDQHAAASQRLTEARQKRGEIDRDLAEAEKHLQRRANRSGGLKTSAWNRAAKPPKSKWNLPRAKSGSAIFRPS